MDLHNLRNDVTGALQLSGLSQIEFATKHGLSYSWLNKFLMGHADNPRLSSISQLEAAVKAERAEADSVPDRAKSKTRTAAHA